MAEAVIKTKGLVKKYQGFPVLDDLNIEVGKGQIYGLVGNNGAGKTTLIRIMCGMVKPTAGELELFGSPSNLLAARKRIGVVLDNPGILLNMNAYENMVAQCILTGADKSKIQNILKLVDLQDTNKLIAKKFSLGMKRRLSLARAFVNEPEILILDEPTNGLDPSGIKELRDVLLGLARQRGVTILISSHIIAELSNLATNYGVLANGRIIKNFSAEELNNIVSSRGITLENYFISILNTARSKGVR